MGADLAILQEAPPVFLRQPQYSLQLHWLPRRASFYSSNSVAKQVCLLPGCSDPAGRERAISPKHGIVYHHTAWVHPQGFQRLAEAEHPAQGRLAAVNVNRVMHIMHGQWT